MFSNDLSNNHCAGPVGVPPTAMPVSVRVLLKEIQSLPKDQTCVDTRGLCLMRYEVHDARQFHLVKLVSPTSLPIQDCVALLCLSAVKGQLLRVPRLLSHSDVPDVLTSAFPDLFMIRGQSAATLHRVHECSLTTPLSLVPCGLDPNHGPGRKGSSCSSCNVALA